MDTRDTSVAKGIDTAAHQRVPRGILPLAILHTFLTQKVIVFTHADICCLLIPRDNEDTQNPSDFFLKGSVHSK